MTNPPPGMTRRQFLVTTFMSLVSAVAAACGLRQAAPTTPPVDPTSAPPPTDPPAPAATAPPQAAAPTEPPTQAAQVLPPTPACGADEPVTLAQTEGPFYTPNSPERTSLLEPGLPGTPMTLTGYVLSTGCAPVAGALVDFWHADDAGVYDNVGFKLRGHQFTDAGGRFTLETIVPGLYPGRTRHFHVKVQAANQPVLTTQLYFPDEPDNSRDGLFRPELLMDVQPGAAGPAASFNFVLEVG